MSHPEGRSINDGIPKALLSLHVAANLLQWAMQQQVVTNILHYLNNFLALGCPSLPECQIK